MACLLEDWRPAAAFILAPGLGAGHTPLVVTADAHAGIVRLGRQPQPPPAPSQWISATRSAGAPARPFDALAAQAGYRLKTRTTSQSLDMLRSVVDLGPVAEATLPSFELFWRRQQKLWDGVAGLCLGAALGLRACDEDGKELPFGPEFLSAATPVFNSTVTGRPETVAWFLEAQRG